ncbi:hypothetical protein [Thermococcus henrietii]|uniref:hypothetical protein n=1 Tax=Thermococcus henrietii TaxID=2016361 RepID=UPI001CB7857D|nr:hypothetical protein [Thermococcus henrietii]
MTRFITLSEELAVKLEHARAEWEAQKIQVLVEDDEVPEGYEVALELEDLVNYLEGLEVPTKVIIDQDVYRVKLRKKVPYDRYKEILSGLNALSHARWDKKARAILVDRTRPLPPEEEVIEVEEIIITPKEVRA